MKATIKGTIYDTDAAQEICNSTSPDGDDLLYRTEDGRFFLVVMSMVVDGVKLRPSEEPEDVAPDLAPTDDSLEAMLDSLPKRKGRIEVRETIIPLTDREALVWCVKTQLPQCFLGAVLDCI